MVCISQSQYRRSSKAEVGKVEVRLRLDQMVWRVVRGGGGGSSPKGRSALLKMQIAGSEAWGKAGESVVLTSCQGHAARAAAGLLDPVL